MAGKMSKLQYLHTFPASLIYRILPGKPKYTVKLMHAGMHGTICIALGVGLAAAVRSHNLKNSPHFYSLHSWLGITTIGFYYLQVNILGLNYPINPVYKVRVFSFDSHPTYCNLRNT
jgi:hypothetical protein